MELCRAAAIAAGLMLVAAPLPGRSAALPDQLAQATPEPDVELEVDATPEPERLRRQALEHLDRGAEQRRLGDLAAASADFAAAQGIFNRLADPAGEAAALLALGQIDLERQEYDFATTSLDGARHLFRQLGDRRGEADALVGLAELERDTGELDLAARDFETAAALYDAVGATDRAAWALDQAAALPSME